MPNNKVNYLCRSSDWADADNMYIDMLGLSWEHFLRSISRGRGAKSSSFSLPASREMAGRQERGLSKGQSTEVNSRKWWLVLWIDVCWLTHVLHAFEMGNKKREPKTEKQNMVLPSYQLQSRRRKGLRETERKTKAVTSFDSIYLSLAGIFKITQC